MTTPTNQDPRKGGTSASNAAADRLCPGRHIAQKGQPDVPTEWSEHGQKIHAALAENPGDGVNMGALASLTVEQRDLFDAHREIEKRVIAQIWGGEPDASNRVWREQRYWCRVPKDGSLPVSIGVLSHYLHSGQADMVMRRTNKVLIQDYKSLSGDTPESPKNEQLRDLAVLVWRNLEGVDEVYVCINQPLHTWTPELCKYTKPELEQAEQEMWDRVRKSNDPNSPRIAGESQCRYCKARSICKEHAVWAASMIPETIIPSPFLSAMSSWSPDQRVVVAIHLPRLRKLLDEAEAFLKEILKNDPESVPGFFLKPGAPRTPVNNPQELFNRFSATGGSLDQFMQCVSVSKGEFEAQVRIVSKTKGKALKHEVEKLMEGIVDVNPVSPSLSKKKE